jgi:molybdopterin-containing oxidoreductase family iron-sulfur binding subunit
MKPPADKPTHWRSLAELENDAEFRERVAREFPTPLDPEPADSPARRRFLQIMGASVALGACRWKEDKLLPFSDRPEGHIPGETRRYATAMELGGVATGLLVTSYDGRPIKVDGNPAHPSSRGAASVYHQGSLLNLYDPDRARAVSRRDQGKRVKSSWAEFEEFARKHFQGLRGQGGQGLRILSDRSSSPSLEDLRRRLLVAYPRSGWTEFSAALGDNEHGGSMLAFGAPYRTLLSLENAKVIVALDADLVSPANPAGIANARAIAAQRTPDNGTMNRIYSIESALSLTGAIADHRLPLRSGLIKAVAAALDAELGGKLVPADELGAAQPKPQAPLLNDAKVKKFLDVVVKDLLANAGASIVVAGVNQPPEVHAIVHRINHALGNVGRTLTYAIDARGARGQLDMLKGLVDEMNAGSVDTLLILDANPVYTAPADLAFSQALSKVKNIIALSEYVDETAQLATWHLPLAHYLESWGDGRAHDGTVTLQQPLIEPLYGGRSKLEVVALISADPKTRGLDIVERTHAARLGGDPAWRKSVHDGVIPGTSYVPSLPRLKPIAPVQLEPEELQAKSQNGQLEVSFAPDLKLYDGRFANNAWLQELPESITKQSWGNAALIHPKTAAELGITETSLVKLSVAGRELMLPAVFVPGQALGSIRVALGHGRSTAGQVGGWAERKIPEVGANAYVLRSVDAFHFASGLSVSVVGNKQKVASTQDLYAIDTIGRQGAEQRLPQIVREQTLTEFQKDPTHSKHLVHHPPLLNLWRDPVSYEGHKWGMAIDLNRCIGCTACVAACQAENNIPVVGKDNVERGREMLWLRVDRYYSGNPESPKVNFQPMPCQHCENAPCEQVCPVGATLHTSEGLNDMVYNRCIGTRYCSNNCPYKVRRFNYFNYHLDKVETTPFQNVTDPDKKLKHMVFNPEVTVRARGVMEKCTFCVQRIQNVKIKAKNAKRPIKDGEIKTACQDTCPTDAIVFGDLNDKSSVVAKLHALPRSYKVLEELNNRPRVAYLARVRNPHPELG